MKKKLLVVLLLFAAIFLVGCGKDNEESDSSKDKKVVDKHEEESDSSKAKKVVDKYIESLDGANGKQYCKSFPQEMIDSLFDDNEDCYEEGDKLGERLEGTFTYKIGDYEELEGEDLEDYKEDLEDKYDMKPSKLKKIYIFEVTIKEDTGSSTVDVYVGKYDGSWYILNH